MTTADQKAWEGFVKGNWCDEIDVRDFIQLNYTPYEGDASFLAGPVSYTHLDIIAHAPIPFNEGRPPRA